MPLFLLLLIACSTTPADPLQAALKAKGDGYVPRTRHLDADGSPTHTNRLILETSPYLLQHAHNPVNWYAWGEEAFAAAQAADKPILLSVGYSTCHWCHVMEEESFEDPAIAAFLNEHFVAIKVDREERPDVDAAYMAAARALSGRSGWPMTVVMTPDKEPFFAGTYFPARTGDRGKREGFESILQRLQQEWLTERATLVDQGRKLSQRVASRGSLRPGASPEVDRLHAGARALTSSADEQHGGFGNNKKFPRPSSLALLLRYHRRTGDTRALSIVEMTLHAMADGGIHDQVGGGFHRYTVDQRWQIPHFEKMLYDNAQLAALYTDGFQATGDARFAEVVASTLDYLAREMSHPEGGFYSATDADSLNPAGHREEGQYFTWTPGDLRDALEPKLYKLAVSLWGVSVRGNFEGRNVLHRPHSLRQVGMDLGKSEGQIRREIPEIQRLLRLARDERAPPLRDDKVLTAWNGLAISAFARAGRVFGRADWIERAGRAADFLLGQPTLTRTWIDGKAGAPATLEDHAFLVAGLLELFEASGEARWLEAAKRLDGQLLARFEAEDGGWYRTAHDAEALLLRERPHTDGAEPSGNGVHVLNLLRLGAWTTDAAYSKRAEAALSAFGGELKARPASSPTLLMALDWQSDDPREVVIAGGGPMAESLKAIWTPTSVTWTHGEEAAVPWSVGKTSTTPKAWVCHEGLCKAPTDDPAILASQLAPTPLKDAATPDPAAQPAPWQYNGATNKHWHPGHSHWHDGRPPKDR